jgi:hypothetical protein
MTIGVCLVYLMPRTFLKSDLKPQLRKQRMGLMAVEALAQRLANIMNAENVNVTISNRKKVR